MKKFDEELAQLKQRLVHMGELAESMATLTVNALIGADRSRLQEVRTSELTLDRFQIDIDREAIRLITIYTPVAKDLRFLLMMARINSELERIGDHAVDNCQYVEMLPADSPRQPLRELSAMSATTLQMVHDGLEAFRQEDIETARAVIALDDRVDEMRAGTFRGLLEHTATEPELVRRGVSLILAAQSLKRIADHATNICEEVIYLVEAEDVRHRT